MKTTEVEIRGHRLVVALLTPVDENFWTRTLPRDWETDTFDFLDAHVRPGSVFVDVGGWIGPISLYAAALGARVIALEPDPVAHESLARNAELNNGRLAGSLEVRQEAFDTAPGVLRIHEQRGGFGTSASSAVGKGERYVEVPVIPPEDLIAWAGTDVPAVLKVDIEAHELFCGPAIARLRRALNAPMNLSIHPRSLEKSMGWKRWIGLARREALARTRTLLDEFPECELTGQVGDQVLDEAALRARLKSGNAKIPDFSVVAVPKTPG